MAKRKTSSTRKKSTETKARTRTKKKVAATSKKKQTSKKSATKKAASKKSAKKASTKKPAAKKRPAAKATASVSSKSKPSGKSNFPLPKVLNSPDFSGKPQKIERDIYPENASDKDFKCFGPPATIDGDFADVRICDLGCFTQDGKDSNKYYHGAVVQHKKSKNWYAYFEWGRTGGSSCSFQFVACQSEQDARTAFSKQISTKNDKRGEWVTIAGIRTLRAKKGKDCYLVRPMVTRTTGLPDARNIKAQTSRSSSAQSNSKSKGDQKPSDPKTVKLLRDLQLATIAYTRKSMADSCVPTQRAIDEARQILVEAHTQVAEYENDIEGQINDKKLRQMTRLLYSRIPRNKKVGAPPESWMLISKNIRSWQDDLDAFESALRAVEVEMDPNFDIMGDMKLELNWIDPKSKTGKFLVDWIPKSTTKDHKKIDHIEILNIWTVEQEHAKGVIEKAQKAILRSKVDTSLGPEKQPRARKDLEKEKQKAYKDSNTCLLFHGTRSVNVNGILRESLRMPRNLVAVTITGEKFGPGIYFSDDWKKSADYTNAKGAAETGGRGAVKGRHAFMFLADVVLGSMHLAPEIHGYLKPPRGKHSVFGKAGYSGVDDNEFVIYKKEQNKLRYLIEFKTS